MNLLDQVNKKRKEIKTDGYPMSISEWISMYEKKELDIHPEFQRFFRWSNTQKTSLIESILLGIPLPPIFVSQREDGVWDVVDGLQRLSTIFQFAGILVNEEDKKIVPLVLHGTKYLPALNNIQWENEKNPQNELSKELQLLIKRSKISASIVLKESDKTAKYDLFQRLNTGGSELSPQEVRNCLLVMINRPFFEWLKTLSKNKSFIDSIALSDRPIEESYDIELVVRFIILSQVDKEDIINIGDVGEFLTDRISVIANDLKFKLIAVKEIFAETFSIIYETLGDDAFKRYNPLKQYHEGGFLLSLFEVIALGIAYNVSANTLCPKKVRNIVQRLSSNPEYTKWSSSGVNASRRLPKLIPLGRAIFEKK